MYPKWITRATGIGPVLVLNEKEENQLLDDWDTEQLALAEAAAAEAKAAALAAEEDAKVVLKAKNGK
jgi:hypothetical protein